MSELALRLIAKNKAAHERGEDARSLDLGNCGLTELPEELFKCLWLEELTLSNRYWSATIKGWEVSKNLGAPNKFNELPIKISNLTNLKILRIGGDHRTPWNISDLSPIAGMTGLQSLYLSYNRLTEVGFLRELTGLQSLDLSYNKIIDVSILRDRISLKSLIISHNKLTDLSFLRRLTGLEYLDFSYNQLTNLGFLSKLTGLKFLDFSQNQLTDVGHLRGLVGLEFLYLSGNMLRDMNFLRELTGLQTLSLSNNQLTDLDPLRKLTRLQTLYISGNQPADLDFLCELTGLQTLYLTGNQAIDVSLLRKLTGLHTLYLSGNQLTNLGFLSELTSLKSLSLRDSQLTDVDFLSELIGLEYLYLSGNQLTDLGFLRKLTGLKSLYLRDNKLSDIGILHKLTRLQSLDLIGNEIKEIPLEVLEALRLKIDMEAESAGSDRISLKNNPIESPPVHVLKQGREFTIDYLKNREEPLNECKVIIIGRGGVGKTSLQKRLTNQAFDPHESQTHGIRKVCWSDGVKAADGKPITINFWDFGGQKIQQALHQFFYSKNALYILVLNQRIDEDPNDFLELVRTYGHNSPVLIAYNNTKNLNIRELQTYDAPKLDSSLRIKYTNIGRTFGLCCGQDHDPGIGELRNYLQQYIPTLHHVQALYPRSWLKIKHELLDKVQNGYIYFDVYEKLCQDHKVEDQKIQRSLAEMLNAVGTITFFDKEFRGKRHIFNPDWLTTGTYEIIDSEQTRKKKGRINWSDLENIFSRNLLFNYQSIDYDILLLLMKEFDLCHNFDNGDWLVPSSLEGEYKMDLVAFKNGDYSEYRLQYKVSLPSSVIHRFIAHNIEYAHDNDYWKNGIVVNHHDSDTKLFVEADARERQIRLFAKGERTRDCWESFRKDLKDFSKGFDYEELVILSSGESVSYQYLIEAWEDGEENVYISRKTGKINVRTALGFFESPAKSLQELRNISKLIENGEIKSAFDKIESLKLNHPDLGPLKKEYRSGTSKYDSDFSNRFLMVINECFANPNLRPHER